MTVLAGLALIALAAAPEGPRIALEAALRCDAASSFDLASQAALPGAVDRRARTRLRPSISWTPSEGLHLVARGQVYGASGPGGPHGFELYEAFAGFARERYEIRIGRQEIALGGGFLLGADDFFDGASYDAVHAVTRTRRGVALAAFAGRSVDAFSPGQGGTVAGLVVSAGGDGTGIEAYVVEDAAYATSFGVRAVASRASWALEVEPVVQAGGAWGGHLEVATTLRLGVWRPRLRLGHARATGDFLHPRHDAPQVGDLGVVGELSGFAAGDAIAVGLRASSIGADLPLGRRAGLAVTLRRFDAGAVAGALSKNVGRELDASITWALSENVAVEAGFARFVGGSFVREGTGANLDARYVHAALRGRF